MLRRVTTSLRKTFADFLRGAIKLLVTLKKAVLESILVYAKACHPREGVLLLRGKTYKDKIVVDEVLLPPVSVKSWRSTSFPLSMLPIDLSIVGTAHSHPSGILTPSPTDLNNFYGKIMIIVAYPYSSSKNLAVFDGNGKPIEYYVTK